MLTDEQIAEARRQNALTVGEELADILPISEKPWWRQSHLLKLNARILACMCFSSTTGYDGSLMNGLQSLDTWQTFMDTPSGGWLGFINSINSIGALCGLCIVGMVAERFGRKVPLLICIAFISLGAGLGAGAKNIAMFIIGRYFIGFGSSFVLGAPLMIAEISYPTHRARATSLYNCFYYLGSLISSWVIFGVRHLDSWSWRTPTLLQCGIPVLLLLPVLSLPESPRWLISKGKHAQAREVLVKYHAGGNQDSVLVDFEMEEISRTIELERFAAKESSWANLWATPGNRHRLFITISLGFFSQWNGVGVVSYYLSKVLTSVGITSTTKQTLINGFLQLWNLLCALFSAYVVDYAGRRMLFLVSGIGMFCSYVMITGLSGAFAETGNNSTGIAMIPFLFIYYGFYDIAFTPLLFAYPAEIWNYMNRSRGLVVVQVSSFLALIFNLFVNSIALDNIAWKYYFVFIGVLIVVIITTYFTYPETRGHTLEEMAQVFDKDEVEDEEANRHVKDILDSMHDKIQEERAETAEQAEMTEFSSSSRA
ncbi:general substrate transporter [Myxozyma melibiosi]|uniref:General substrate transporter n=1 Tax=Myxozyma melibiosi TaxID=54550 RepID=A0ABR1FCS1_9ASCO